MAFLTAVNGATPGRRFELNSSKNVLGRHPDCNIILDGAGVSRYHAMIEGKGSAFVIEDQKSRNRTYVNGEAIEHPTKLNEGDLIRICDLEFSFHDREPQVLLDSGIVSRDANRDGSSFGIMLVEDDEDDVNARSFTSKFDIKESQSGTLLTTSAEARLNALLEISNSLGKAVSLEDVLPKVLDTLFKIFFQADRGFIVLRDPDGELRPRWAKTRRADQEDNARISRTVLREVVETKQGIISLDATADGRFKSSDSIADFRIRSIIVAPLLDSNGEAIGAIQMDALEQRNRFEDKDFEILLAVANQAGIAIENAQLHDQMVERELVEQDLKHARMVQQAFVPSQPLKVPGYGFFHFYNPMLQVGGDYFDYVHLQDGRIAIVVADVTGHGIAAAMFMAKVSSETRFALATISDPAQAISTLNERLSQLMVERFVTMVVTILDPETGEVVVVNAGHMAPIVRTRTGELVEPSKEESGLALGIIDCEVYQAAKFTLEPGELFALYTDGINESVDEKGNQFTIERMMGLIASSEPVVHNVGQTIINQVTAHVGKAAPFDDMCLVVVGRSKASPRTI